MKKSIYTTNAILTSGVLYYVLELSESGRTLIDWVVIGLVVGAILWNVIQLGRRLHGSEGNRALLHLLRTLMLWAVGLANTAFIRLEDAGSWLNGVGWAFLLIACVDTVALFQRERRCTVEPPVRADESPTSIEA